MHPEAVRALPMLLLGFVVLAVSHVAVYLVLAGDARTALEELEGTYEVAALESARRPGQAPPAGSAEYSPWLRSYEQWHAAGEYEVHARQEGLMRGGMILSFLIGLGLLVHGFFGLARTPRRRATDRPARARRGARDTVRPVPAARPMRAARPVRAVPARPVRARPAAAQPRRLRKSA